MQPAQLLAVLAAGEPLSGATLAVQTGVTRAAIWKTGRGLARPRRADRGAWGGRLSAAMAAADAGCRADPGRIAGGAGGLAGGTGSALGARLHVQRIAAARHPGRRLQRAAGRNPDRRTWTTWSGMVIAAGAEPVSLVPQALRAGLCRPGRALIGDRRDRIARAGGSGRRRRGPEVAQRSGWPSPSHSVANWAASWSS